MSQNKKVIGYFTLIFGFIIVLLGLFIFCCFNLKKSKNDDTLLARLESDNKKSIDKFILNSAYVCDENLDVNLYKKYIDRYSIIQSTGMDMDTSEIRVPYFNLSSEETVNINTNIQNLYCGFVHEFNQNYQKFANEGYNDVSKMHLVGPMILNYEAYLYNDILSVAMYYKKPDSCYYYETYVFDTNTNKLLSVSDLEKIFNFDFKSYDYGSILHRFYDGAGSDMLSSTSIYNINDSIAENKINIVRPYRDADNGIGIFVDNDGNFNFLLPINDQTGDECGQRVSLVTLK